MEALEARSPQTGETIATYAIPDAAQVDAAMRRARMAQAGWGKTSIPERIAYVRRLRNILIQELDDLVQSISLATGKPSVEALTGDLFPCIDLMHYYEKRAEKILQPQSRKGSLLFRLSKFYIEYEPLGVAAIFSPWNYPLQLSLVPVVTALIAGNCVLLKPSEITPSIGALIVSLCQRAGLPPYVVQVLQGGKEVGQRIIEAVPDKIFFTGSVAAGKEVLRMAAESLIPVSLELGGKDPMIVFEDAHFDRAVRGAVYGAFANAGQACVSVERLYVQDTIYDRFVEHVAREARKVRVGTGPDPEIGPLVKPGQKRVIDEQLRDALDQGAALATEPICAGNFYHPLVLKHVNHSMKIMQEETFGPVLPIMPFSGEEEAVALANDTIYGLNASVWTQDLDKAKRVARRLISGSCAINDVLKNIANPHMPFGGEKQSGSGRYHGPEGLYAFSRCKSVMVYRGRAGKELNWFPYSGRLYETVKALIRLLYSDGNPIAKSRQLIKDTLNMIR